MSRLTKLAWLLMVFIFLGLASCSGGKPTTDPSLAFTQIWQTVEVAQAQTALAASPTPSLTNTPAVSPTLLATNTPLFTNTPLLTNTPLPGAPSSTPFTIPTQQGTQPAGVDNFLFLGDVTFPDGAEVFPGAPFVKTWRVKNLGPSTWDHDYSLIFGWGGVGTNWNTTPPSYFTAIVLPGETLEISVSLMAPTTAGSYGASFRLQNDKGYNFGATLTVIVTVK
jgi:hypothetical protein